MTDEYDPDKESLAITLLFNLIIAQPSSIPKVLDLLEALWEIDEKEEGVIRMEKRTWTVKVRDMHRCKVVWTPP